MLFFSTIRKTITGVMQSVGGWVEPISRAQGVRARNSNNKSAQFIHDGIDGVLEATAGAFKLIAANPSDPTHLGNRGYNDGRYIRKSGEHTMTLTRGSGILTLMTNGGVGYLYANNRLVISGNVDLSAATLTLPAHLAAGSGTSADIQALSNPTHGKMMFDTNLGYWVIYNDLFDVWQNHNGVNVYE